MKIPTVWTEPFSDYIENRLKSEAAKFFRIHQLPDTLEFWLKYREELRENIWKHLGVRPDHALDLDLHETGEIKMDGYVIKNLYYQSRPGIYVTGNLYIPDGDGPFPGIVGMHGHWSQGRLAERVQSRGHSLAQNGYVCLQVDAWGSGERSTVHGEFEYHGAGLGGALFNVGETLMGAQIVDNMRAVDVLCSLDYVDPDRIGATGASGGGNQTMWLTAMDERIKAAMPVVSVGTFESYVMGSNCICECLPDGLTFTEESGILALVAPRALKICNCLGDSNPTFFPAEMLRSCKEAGKVFQAYGKGSSLAYQVFNLPHGYWPEIREAMLGWFNLRLKGIGCGAPEKEKAFECLPEDKLMVFEKGKRPAGVIPIAEYCRNKGAELKKSASASGDKENELKNILKFSGPELKAVHRYVEKDGWETLAFETLCGDMIPALLRKPRSGSPDYVIAASSLGKADLVNSEYFKKLVEGGKGIIIFDSYAGGETAGADMVTRSPYHTTSRALLWLGRTLYGEWTREYVLLANWCKESLKAENIELFGYRESGIIAVFAGALSGTEIDVIAEKSPRSFVFTTNEKAHELSMGFCLPNILKWGDLDTAVSLNKGKVTFVD
ncbi:MAG: acetylxylan esterase [Victivallaceae bacterium]